MWDIRAATFHVQEFGVGYFVASFTCLQDAEMISTGCTVKWFWSWYLVDKLLWCWAEKRKEKVAKRKRRVCVGWWCNIGFLSKWLLNLSPGWNYSPLSKLKNIFESKLSLTLWWAKKRVNSPTKTQSKVDRNISLGPKCSIKGYD